MQQRMWLASWIPRSVALTIGLSFAQAGAAATLSSPVSWGSPDQPWGQRRAVTAADRSAIAAYRSGHKAPIFATNFASISELQSDWSAVSAAKGAVTIRLSTALGDWAGGKVPDHPETHDMFVESVRVFAQ